MINGKAIQPKRDRQTLGRQSALPRCNKDSVIVNLSSLIKNYRSFLKKNIGMRSTDFLIRIWDTVFGGGERLVSRKKTALAAEEEEGDGVRQGGGGSYDSELGKEVVSDEIGGDQGGVHLGVGLGGVEGVLVQETVQTEKGLLEIDSMEVIWGPVGPSMIGRFGISGLPFVRRKRERRQNSRGESTGESAGSNSPKEWMIFSIPIWVFLE